MDDLSKIFSALADPTRRAILARLAAGSTNVTALAEPFLETMSLPAVTKHLKVLEKAGLLTKTRQAQWRSCQMESAPLQSAYDWLEVLRAEWEERFDQLDDYLASIKESPKSK